MREKNVAALTIFRAPSPNAHTNVAALIERHAGQQVTGGLDDRVMPPNLSLRGGRRPTWRPERKARGSALWVQSHSTMMDNRKAIGEIVTAFPRLPRPLRGLAMTNRRPVLFLTAACSYRRHCAGPGCPRPYSYKPSHPNLQKKIGSRLRPRPGSGCLFKKGRKKRESIGKLILQRSAAEAEAPREAVAAALLLLLLALILLLALLRIA